MIIILLVVALFLVVLVSLNSLSGKSWATAARARASGRAT